MGNKHKKYVNGKNKIEDYENSCKKSTLRANDKIQFT